MELRHALIGLTVLLGAGLFISYTGDSVSEAAAFDEAKVYYSPNCGCCAQHISYLDRSGVDVERIQTNSNELEQLKNKKDIPDGYRSCHTTVVDGKFVEGHVPVEVFNEFVEEDPDIDGIALPGMPSGSPGMPGSKKGVWTFHSIEDGEVTGEFIEK